MNSVQNPAIHANLEARFAAAARHSRMVRFLRIAVPGAVCLAMAGVIGISIFNPFRMLMPKLPLDMGNLVVSGSKITMESPHLSGYTPDQRPYELWAKTAVQDITDPDRVELNKLRTKVLMQDGSTLFLDSLTGLFDNKQQTLELQQQALKAGAGSKTMETINVRAGQARKALVAAAQQAKLPACAQL